MLSSANPRDRAFQAQSEAGVRNAAVTPEVQIPVERLFREVTFAQPFHEQIVVGNAFAAADDFAVAFGREHVKSESQFGPQSVRLHVKRLEGRRIAMHHYRAVIRARKNRFLVAAEVVSPLYGISALLEDLDRFVVGNSRKRSLDIRKLRRVASHRLKLSCAIFHHGLHDVTDQTFAERHHVFQVRVGSLRLKHPEFGEVAARFRFLGAEGRTKRINLAERHGRRLDVELA